MASDSFKSPNAIPPRTSSTGIIMNGHVPQKPVLRPLSEIDWMSQKSKASAYPTPLSPPPHDPPRSFGDELVYERTRAWGGDKEKIILSPYDYLLGHPGKDIRSQLLAAFNTWLQVPEETLEVITKIVGMLHTASLLIDDVEDNSILRRGIPVAHSIFGTAQTINSANYAYFLALGEISKLQNAKMIEIYTEELINLHRGQGMDLFWRDTLTCPSENDYLEMVHNKTGGLFRFAIKLMQAASPVNIDCVPLVNTIGLMFQILDDHLNLFPTYASKKGFCEDLTEGKFSFPVIHAIRSDTSNLTLLNILKQKTKGDEVKQFAVSYLERMGSFEYSKKCIEGLREKALDIIGELEKQTGEAGPQGADAIREILAKLVVP